MIVKITKIYTIDEKLISEVNKTAILMATLIERKGEGDFMAGGGEAIKARTRLREIFLRS